jgi:hypothetical protein
MRAADAGAFVMLPDSQPPAPSEVINSEIMANSQQNFTVNDVL